MKLVITILICMVWLGRSYASSVIDATYTLQDGVVTAPKLSPMSATEGDVLTYNQSLGLWQPRPLSAIGLLGTWNANTNNPALSDGGAVTNPSFGDFYVVSNSGTSTIDGISNWSAGDWILFNGSTWERVVNSSGAISFNARQGAVMPQAGDYDWAMINLTVSSIDDLADVDTSSTPIIGQVLKWNGSNWVADDDALGGAADSVNSTTILDGTIVDADISATADIAPSKIQGLASALSNLNATTTATQNSIASAQSLITLLTASSSAAQLDIAIQASNIDSLNDALDLKEDLIATGTAAQYWRGDKTWQTLNTDVVVESSTLYFTEARVLSTPLTGFAVASSTSALANGNSLLLAFGKLQAQVNAITSVTSTGDFKKDGSVTMTGDLSMNNNGIRFKDNDGGDHYVTFRAPSAMAADLNFFWPTTAGSNGQMLSTNGAGGLSWLTATIGGGDVTAVTTSATSGLSGGAASGDITLAINFDDSTIGLSSNNLQVKDTGITGAKLATGLSATKVTVGTLPDSVHSTSVSLLGSSIDTSEITDYTITNADISSSTKISWSKVDFSSATSGSFNAVPLTRMLTTSSTSSGLQGGGLLSADLSLSLKLDNTSLEISNANKVRRKISIDNKSSSYTVLATDRGKLITVTASSTITLPDAATVGSGFNVYIKNSGTAIVYVYPTGADLIDNENAYSLRAQYTNAMFLSNGSDWYVFGQAGTVRAGIIGCPAGYVRVPANAGLSVPDFCVMQYEAKNSGGNAVSQESGSPWDNINMSDAWDECNDLNSETSQSDINNDANSDGTYGLISNPEWMTIARNAESVAANWSGGSVGSGCMYRGNNGTADTCGYNGSNPESGTGRDTKARLTLSNGSEVWDMAGNVLEWVDWAYDQARTNAPDTSAGACETNAELNAVSCGAIVSNDYNTTAGTYTRTQGVGYYMGVDDDGAIRGGYYTSGTNAGIFTLDADSRYSTETYIGFRCRFRLPTY